MELPIGSILPYFGDINTLRDQNYLVCNGKPFLRTDFPLLYSLLSSVDNTLVINNDSCKLPNLIGTFIRGVDEAGVIDADKRVVGHIQGPATQMPNAKFFVEKDGQHTHLIGTDISAAGSFDRPNVAALKALNHQQNFSTAGTEGGHSHEIKGGDKETRPRNMALNFIIRAK
jgi:Phage Tail Collar Domain